MVAEATGEVTKLPLWITEGLRILGGAACTQLLPCRTSQFAMCRSAAALRALRSSDSAVPVALFGKMSTEAMKPSMAPLQMRRKMPSQKLKGPWAGTALLKPMTAAKRRKI